MQLGIIYSLSASALFGGMYYLATLLRPLSGESLFGIRMVVTLPFLFFAIFVLKKQHEFFAFAKRLKQQPHLILVILITSTIVGSQMWLFLWAPNSGKALEVSMGYLLMPIVMVAFGRLVYKESLSRVKWLAIIFATLGVLNSVIFAGGISWEGVFVFVGYPAYFHIRRKFQLSNIYSFVFEIMCLIPISLYFIWNTDMDFIHAQNPNIYYFIAILSVVSGSALLSYTLASTILPFNMLGLLGYLEPTFMMIISFLIGERLDPNSYFLMMCLVIAVFFLILDGIFSIRKQRKKMITEN
ncbi:EamA family transporter RarD [Actinobacillus pleuropneumoniae]|uniref:EamA family transporter RarD n=1 Tax=Actinobacillus pleuropneumoniae TaxID=715 RepID=UPI003B01F23D